MTVTHRKNDGLRYHCDVCRTDVTNLPRIRCAECVDLDLCVECFARGAVPDRGPNTHVPTHAYRVMDVLTFPIFEHHWFAEEELLMLEALEKYGMGAWQDVADHIGTKSPSEVEEHYYRVFLNSAQWPMPEPIQDFVRQPVPPKHHDPVLPALQGAAGSKKFSKPILKSNPTNHEVAGFMPGRNEWDTDYLDFHMRDEDCVKELEFLETDAPEETELKLAMMEIYNDKLERKYDRKKLIFDRGLHEFKQVKDFEAKKPSDERKLLNEIKVFAKLMSRQDYNDFAEGLLIEHQLKARIKRLQEYRRVGIRTFSEAQVFEQSKASAAQAATKGAAPAVPRPVPLPPLVLHFAPPALAAAATGDVPPSLSAEPAASARASSSTSDLMTAVPPAATTPAASAAPPVAPTPPPPTTGRRAGLPKVPLDISNSENVHLLNDREQALCSTLRFLPKAYLGLKELVLGEYVRRGPLGKRQIREMARIDVNKMSILTQFWIESGWLQVTVGRSAPPPRGGGASPRGGASGRGRRGKAGGGSGGQTRASAAAAAGSAATARASRDSV
ncbi:hypothetical protein BC828DRAFT_390296 [Blastocladiella britannica]|nr:hypothetical protein BC828DRAFT_390296 [Blastocladiella britannica]